MQQPQKTICAGNLGERTLHIDVFRDSLAKCVTHAVQKFIVERQTVIRSDLLEDRRIGYRIVVAHGRAHSHSTQNVDHRLAIKVVVLGRGFEQCPVDVEYDRVHTSVSGQCSRQLRNGGAYSIRTG